MVLQTLISCAEGVVGVLAGDDRAVAGKTKNAYVVLFLIHYIIFLDALPGLLHYHSRLPDRKRRAPAIALSYKALKAYRRFSRPVAPAGIRQPGAYSATEN